MRRRFAVLAAAALGLLGSAGTAAASDPVGAEQAAAQAAGSGQAAGALSGASQSQPTNRNISVRVLSPGDSGSVTQTNSVSSGATAANTNATGQSAQQSQSGSCPCGDGTQAIAQSAGNDQSAAALSLAHQSGATNTNVPVRVLSPGDAGDVEQSNSVDSDATAANLNGTAQTAGQAGGGGTQAVAQEAKSEQDALAASKAEQDGAKNTNISVRVLSPGDDGDVEQTNEVDSKATAVNLNATAQDAQQAQSGGGTQVVGQSAKNDQAAAAASAAKQTGASNTNVPVRVLSPGDGGSVTQRNSVSSSANAANVNSTKQDATQQQAGRGCDCKAGSTQAIAQSAKSDQTAAALSAALQDGASNSNTPVRVGSRGDDGHVSQENTVESHADALNANATKQVATQAQAGGSGKCCGGEDVQAIAQSADSDQKALAASLAAQSGGDKCKCSSGGNSNTPVRVASPGGGGTVHQANTVDSGAEAANLNATSQHAAQQQAGGAGTGIQAIGQAAKSEQAAGALSLAFQHGASNHNAPVRVGSRGDDGRVSQSNDVDSSATAVNLNGTAQHAVQQQHGGCGCHGIAVQAIGQQAVSHQGAAAVSAALQYGASNTSSPVRVASKGDGGRLEQSNDVDSSALAANLNATGQGAQQAQSGGGGIAVQAIGQSAWSGQAALAASAALQLGASNHASPVRVHSKGDSGSLTQANDVASAAAALNANETKQGAGQRQRLDCGCHGTAVQALGQSAWSHQAGAAHSLALQLGAKNGRSPQK